MEHGLFLTGEYRSTRRSTFENYKFILKISTYSTLIQNLSFLCVCPVVETRRSRLFPYLCSTGMYRCACAGGFSDKLF